MLANQGGLEPFFVQPLARPRDRVDTGLQRRRDLAVAPALTTVRGVGFQQDPGLQQLLCWMVSAMDKGGEMLSLLIAQWHYVFLFFFQAEDGIRDKLVTGVQTCALPIFAIEPIAAALPRIRATDGEVTS